MAFLAISFRFVLGFVFVLSSVPKLLARREFEFAVRHYRLLPERFVGPAAALIAPFELICGSALLAGAAVPVFAVGVFCLLMLFSGAVVVNLARGREIDCGCAGLVAPRRISWRAVARNVLLGAAAAFLAVRPPVGGSVVVVPWPAHAAGPVSTSATAAVATAVGLAVIVAALVSGAFRLRMAALQLPRERVS